MNSSTTTWDDVANNRSIEMQFSWQIKDDCPSIEKVIPTNVIIRNDNGSSRTIGVHTEAGRKHLISKIDLRALESQVFAEHSIESVALI